MFVRYEQDSRPVWNFWKNALKTMKKVLNFKNSNTVDSLVFYVLVATMILDVIHIWFFSVEKMKKKFETTH